MECGVCGFENELGARFCGGCGEPLGGAVMFGPYELLGELGRGAMARVWRAWDPNLGREVAIKEPLFDSQLGDDMLQEMGRRFVREAQTAARLSHPGIVGVYAADVYGNRPAIVMELVEGATLGKILESGPLSVGFALDVLDQLLDAVGYAHRQGVVHRDIKPDNIFIDSQRNVKLADFGIAYVDDDVNHATLVGAVLGSPGYMSPEQARGAAVDARSDLFSIGVIAYEMLSGRNPFGVSEGADAAALLYRIVHEPVSDSPLARVDGCEESVRSAIMMALAKDPDDRPQSASEFRKLLGSSSEAVSNDSRQEDGESLQRRSLKTLFLVIVAGIVVLSALLLSAQSNVGTGGGAVAVVGVPYNASGADAPPSSSLSASLSASSSDSKEAVRDSFVGTWSLIEVTVDGELSISRSEMDNLRSVGKDAQFVLSEDGSASLSVFDGETFYGSWAASSETFGTIAFASQSRDGDSTMTFEHVSMALSGDRLVLSQGTTSIVCEKA